MRDVRFVRLPALFLCVAASLALASCGPRSLTLPTDAGAPLADAASIHEQVARACRGVRAFTAELALSGRAGTSRLRGRVVSGFERPASMRLEGVAPFGPPAFILTATAGAATLLLPRDERGLQNASPEDVLGALTGVSLAPADLLAILTGCVVPDPTPRAGRTHGNGWASIDLEGDAVVYLTRVSGGWQVRAGARRGWAVQYANWQGDFPRTIALRSTAGSVAVNVTAEVSQIEANVTIDPAAFTVEVPASARPLTLDELRESGPLRGSE